MLKKVFISLSILSIFVLADGFEYLNNKEREILNTQKKIDELSSKNLKLDWIEPIIASYSYSKNNSFSKWQKVKYFKVSLSQPIFKSGGIYFAIKYANANKTFRRLSTKIQENSLIKKIYELTLNLKKLDIQIKQTKIKIKNTKLDIERKKERFLSGDDDVSFLNKAILEKNSLQLQLNELNTMHKKLNSSFKAISNFNYKNLRLPLLKLVSKKEFLKKNLSLKSQKFNIYQAKQLKNMTISNYLPTITLFGDYNYQKSQIENSTWKKNEYKNYGIRVSIPFSLNESRDIQIKKLQLLQEKLKLGQKRRDIKAEYENIYHDIKNLKKKLQILQENINIYHLLYKTVKNAYKAGDKTKEDVQTIKNSLDSLKLDIKITKIDMQLKILELFEKMDMRY